jgi:hypothetical protein
MAINPLTTRPQPPGGVPHRAMFFWSGAVGSADPLDTDSAVNSLISFLDELATMLATVTWARHTHVSPSQPPFLRSVCHAGSACVSVS